MNVTELRFPGFDAAGERGLIRWTLFQHHAVVGVELTARSDTLQIQHHGAADAPGWTSTLADAGLPAPRIVTDPASSPDALHGTAA